jgi:hypothetical protein
VGGYRVRGGGRRRMMPEEWALFVVVIRKFETYMQMKDAQNK